MSHGIVVKIGILEFGKIVDYYDIAEKKEPEVALNVPKIFEKDNYFIFPLKVIDDLGVEQSLVQWFHHSLKVLMHFSRKILNVRYAKELTPKQRIEYTNNWKNEAKNYACEWIDGFIEEIIQYSDETWINIFGSYEDNPKPLLQAMLKFSGIIDEAKKKRE